MEEGDTNETTSPPAHTTVAHQQQHSSSGARSRTYRHRSIDLPHDAHFSPLDLQPNDPQEEDDRRSRLLQPAADALTVQQQQLPLIIVRYKECMKNHAPSSGRHVVDGCGEFMPRSDDVGDLRCAACDCHRNFHRQEIDNPPPLMMQPPPRRTTATTMHRFPPPPPPPVIMMTFGGGGTSMGAESSSEDLDDLRRTGELLEQSRTTSCSRKRHRTKFSKEQKEMMADFAERIGWRIDKGDESEVDMFCSRIGVKRKVFKVWMHNNKQRSGKPKQM